MAGVEVVSLRNVTVKYDNVTALENVSLTVAEYDFLGIIGPNGGGKSTLLKVILGLVKPDSGSVSVLGKPPEQSRDKIGYVSQHYSFDRDFPVNVRDVVTMGRYGRAGLLRRYNSDDRAAVTKALSRVGMLAYEGKQIGSLSGGEQQRVFIARALVAEPKLLMLDEPMSSVDSAMQTEFYELLRDLKQSLSIVMVSHDIGAVSVYVDSIACLNRELVYHGSKEITAEVLETTYKCPVQLIAHGPVPHRVLKEH